MFAEETFHPDIRALLAFGRALAGQEAPPKTRADAQIAERLFVLERGRGAAVIRAFGERLVQVFGDDLRGRDYLGLWLPPDRALLAAFFDSIEQNDAPGVIRATAETRDNLKLGAEIMITPLSPAPPDRTPRLLGMFQPLGGEAFLASKRICRLRLGALHPPLARVQAPVRLVVSND